MLSEQQSIDEFFRKKEEGFAPAPGREDAHWQQMITMLPGSATPGKTRREIIRRRIIGYSGGFITITVITTIIILSLARSGKKASVATAKTGTYKNTAVTKQPASPSLTTTAAKQSPGNPLTATPAATAPHQPHKLHDPHTIYSTTVKPAAPPVSHSKPTATKTAGQPVAANVPRKPWKQSVTSDTVTTIIPVKNSPDAAELLGRFYSQLQPPPQEFLIRTEWDTTLVAKEGTRLFIPSHAFVSKTGKPITGAVKIVVEEFYNYDKMIAAGLSTTSGGEQLVSGGMLHIVALVDGHELLLQPSVSLKVKMPTNNYDGRMQLFTGSILSKTTAPGRQFIDAAQVSFHTEGDTAAASPTGAPGDKEINWMADEQWQHGYLAPQIRVIDLQNIPSHVSYGNKTIATFYLSKKSVLTKEEMTKEMQKRYGYYYEKIKVKHMNILRRLGDWAPLGDSIDLAFKDALQYKLVSAFDSIQYMKKYIADSIRYFAGLSSERKEYIFAVKNLGWINCDRFANDSRPKVDFTLNLGGGAEARNYHAQLVFARYQSVMTGYYGANKLLFSKIPENEPVQLICVGVKNGKVVTCVQSLTASAHEVDNLVFEETTPEQFKQKIKALNLQ